MKAVTVVRTRHLVALVALSLVSLLFYVQLYPLPRHYYAHLIPEPTCTTFASSLDGRWIPRVPAYETLDDFTLGDERGNLDAQKCVSPTGHHLERTLAVANWVWKPNHCKMRTWDAEAFLVECLKMPHGLILVGDSISGQQFDALRNTIGQGDDSLLVDPRPRGYKSPWTRVSGSGSMFLNPRHPLYDAILKSGRFSPLRLERPIITRLTSYHLVSNSFLAEHFNAAGGNSTTGRSLTRYAWGSDPDFVPSVKAALDAYDEVEEEDVDRQLEVGLTRGTEEASVPTVVIINSGAHWEQSRFDGTTEQAVIMTVFENMVDDTTFRLQSLPHAQQRLRLMARTNPPPTDDCVSATEPLEPPNQVPPGTSYNHPSYPAMDDLWRANARVEVLDVRPLVGTRPDGRRMPPRDCLHVCISVARSWNELLWNVM
ncbi:hypothetical protein RQP46_010175 [Phenoliferia psychrophenolica]